MWGLRASHPGTVVIALADLQGYSLAHIDEILSRPQPASSETPSKAWFGRRETARSPPPGGADGEQAGAAVDLPSITSLAAMRRALEMVEAQAAAGATIDPQQALQQAVQYEPSPVGSPNVRGDENCGADAARDGGDDGDSSSSSDDDDDDMERSAPRPRPHRPRPVITTPRARRAMGPAWPPVRTPSPQPDEQQFPVMDEMDEMDEMDVADEPPPPPPDAPPDLGPEMDVADEESLGAADAAAADATAEDGAPADVDADELNGAVAATVAAPSAIPSAIESASAAIATAPAPVAAAAAATASAASAVFDYATTTLRDEISVATWRHDDTERSVQRSQARHPTGIHTGTGTGAAAAAAAAGCCSSPDDLEAADDLRPYTYSTARSLIWQKSVSGLITRGTRAAVAAALAPTALASPRFSYNRADEEPGDEEEDPSRPFAAHDASRPDEADALGYALRWSRPEDIATVYAQMQAHVGDVGSGGHPQSHHRRALSTFTDASALAAAARRAATAFRRAPIEPTAETPPVHIHSHIHASASYAAATTSRKAASSHSRPNSQASAHSHSRPNSRPASAAPSSHSRPASAASADAGSADVAATGSPPQAEAPRTGTTNSRANPHRALSRVSQGSESAVPSASSSPKDQGAAAAEADGATSRSRSWTLTPAPRHGADVPRHGADAPRHGADVPRHGADVPRHGADVPASPPPPPPPTKPSVLDLWPRRHRRSLSTPA